MLSAALSACVSRKPTLELYQDIQTLRLYGFYCAPGVTAALDRRLARLHSWLAAVLGRAELEAIDARFEQERGLVDLVRCPTADERAESLWAYARLVVELERRSLRGPSPSAVPANAQ